MKAKKHARVTVTVHVEGQEAMRSEALMPGYKKGSTTDHAIEGMVRVTAMKALNTARLTNAHEVWDHIHSVHMVNEENAALAEQAVAEASGG